jgi:hypothetical protein
MDDVPWKLPQLFYLTVPNVAFTSVIEGVLFKLFDTMGHVVFHETKIVIL